MMQRRSAMDALQARLGNQWLNANAPFPTQQRPADASSWAGVGWTDRMPPTSEIAYDPASYGWGSPLGQRMPSRQSINDIQTFLDQRLGAAPVSTTPTPEVSPLNQLMLRGRQPLTY